MNFTGSSMESGDEGLVGRGNRIGGLISPTRPYTMEGIAGKNPRYHVGKVYCAAAFDIANRIYDSCGIGVDVFLANRMAEPLANPWFCFVQTSVPDEMSNEPIRGIVNDVMSHLEDVTKNIIEGGYPLF
jgi:S-adenosylmethionine synthetase